MPQRTVLSPRDCDRSQPIKALTGKRTAKSGAILSLFFTICHLPFTIHHYSPHVIQIIRRHRLAS
jgi:hypothetical protein